MSGNGSACLSLKGGISHSEPDATSEAGLASSESVDEQGTLTDAYVIEEGPEQKRGEPQNLSVLGASSGSQIGSRQLMIRKLYAVWTLNMISWMTIADAKVLAYLNHYKGDTAACMRASSQGAFAMMLSNFAIAPALAQVADALGRRSLLLLGPAWCLALRTAELLSPRAPTFIVTSALSAFCSATVQGVLTAMTDLFPGDPQGAGEALAMLQTGTLVGAVLGPALGSSLAVRGLRWPVGLSALFSFLQVCLTLRSVPETLPDKERSPAHLTLRRPRSPLVCVRLFCRGPQLAAAAVAQLFAHFTEPIMLGRVSALILAETLGWDAARRGRYAAFEAAVTLPGLLLAGVAARAPCAWAALTAAVGTRLAQHLLQWLCVRGPWLQVAVVPLTAAHGAEQATLSALVLEAGARSGLAQSELRGSLQGLQSLANMIAILLWTKWFEFCKQIGRPRRFYMGAAAAASCELVAGCIATACGSANV